MNWRRTIGLLLIGAGLAILTLKLPHGYDPTPPVARLSAKASPRIAQTIHRIQPERLVRGVLIILPVCLGAIFLFSSAKPKSNKDDKTSPEAAPSRVTGAQLKKKAAKAAIDSCNVLQVGT